MNNKIVATASLLTIIIILIILSLFSNITLLWVLIFMGISSVLIITYMLKNAVPVDEDENLIEE